MASAALLGVMVLAAAPIPMTQAAAGIRRPTSRLVAAGSPVVVACLAVVLLAVGAPVTAQLPSPRAGGDLCLLTIEELNELTGLRFATMAAGPANCSYDSDPADDLYTIDLRIEDADPTSQDMGDALILIRMQNPDGTDSLVAGLPAWETPNGLWVNTGEGVFVVQPILFFATDPPTAPTFLNPVAELALTRLGLEAASEVPG